MSEHDDEQHEFFSPLRDNEAPEGVDPETGEISEQTPAEAAADDGSDALIKKAEKAQANYARRIRDIFGDAAPQYDCPACNGLGLVWNLDEPQPELVHPDHLVMCEACNGHGEVVTGSRVPANTTTVCARCNGTGFRVATPQPENVTPITPAQPPASAPVMGFMGQDGVFQPLGQPQSAQGTG